MKFLEFRRDSEPNELFERLVIEFIPDIISALKNNQKFEVNPDEPLSPDDAIALFVKITKTLGIVNNFCKIKYKCEASTIKMEMRIRDGSFVLFRFVPLNENNEPITKEKDNISLVLPNDVEQISALNKEGYNIIVLFTNFSAPPQN